MKKYIYKIAIVSFFIIIIYEFTIGNEIRVIKKNIIQNFSANSVYEHKEIVKENIKNLLKKDKILYEEDAEIISLFIKKILKELNL